MPARRPAARPAPSARPRRTKAAAAGVAATLAAGLLAAAPAAAASPDVVLAEVYGGGGNTGATFRNDFVELENRGTATVDLTGWSVQYASVAGTSYAATALTGSIAPGERYVVQLASGGAAGAPLTGVRATGTTNMATGGGKVALVRGSTAPLAGCTVAVTCSDRPEVVDFVGWGTANDVETSPAEPHTNTTSTYRLGPDTDDNTADFNVFTPTPGAPTPAAAPAGTDCSAADTAVGAVQGAGAASPVAGTTVTVQGTVVGDHEGASPALRGFYLQDGGDGDDATSDGVFVFDNLQGLSPDLVRVGQVVQVTGTVAEFQGQTQVTATAVDVCGTGTVAPVDVTLPVSDAGLERTEGMLVRLPQTLSVTEHFQLGRFGQVLLSSGGRLRQPTALHRPGPEADALAAANAANRILLDDGTNLQNPPTIAFGRGGAPLSATNTLRGGDTVTGAVGVLTYGFGGDATASPNAWRVRPVGALGGAAVFEPANPRPAGTPDVGGDVRVASANLLNFFDTFTGCRLGVGGAVTDCRGADNAFEYERQLAKEVALLSSLDADVVGVMELENDGYGPGTALAALVDALNAADGAGTWAAVDVDAATGVVNAAGTDAIRTALLYRPAVVTPVEGATFTDATDLFERRPVAQTFAVRSNGARVTVVANHFKSKGSCPTDAASPDADAGDGQGCWNARRTAQATELARWLREEVVPATRTPDVLVLGDLNAYAGEDPVFTLEQDGFTNLPKRFGGNEAYSFVFDGLWGYLDHMLASPSLLRRVTGSADVHVNADEPSVLDYNTNFKSVRQVGAGPASLYAPDRFRTSDHDPVVTGLRTAGRTRTALTSSAPAATYGGEVRWTATVASDGTRTPTGTVQFAVAGTDLGAPVPLVDGRATSPATTALPPGATEVTATYSGDDGYEGSTASTVQEVRFAVVVTRPRPGDTARAGSTVQVRVSLRDAAGRAVPGALAAQWVRDCRVRLAVSGAQTADPVCAKEYDADDRVVEASWKSARTPAGEVTLTVLVSYPGIDGDQAVERTLRLR